MKNTPFDLTGTVAVITGSSRGIGRSSAELLAKLGAKVVISSRKADACHEVAEGINTARAVKHLADRAGLEMPIVNEVNAVLYEGKSARDAVAELMGRPLREEGL